MGSVLLLREEGSQTAASRHERVATHLTLASIHDLLMEAVGGSLDLNNTKLGTFKPYRGYACSWVGVEQIP